MNLRAIFFNLRAIFFPPRNLPAPHPSCRTYSDAGWVQQVKNHDIARRISAAHR